MVNEVSVGVTLVVVFTTWISLRRSETYWRVVRYAAGPPCLAFALGSVVIVFSITRAILLLVWPK